MPEPDRKDFADRKDHALPRKDHNSGFYFQADSHGDQKDPDQTDDPLLPVRMVGDPLNCPYAKVRQISEEERHRKLHELDRMIILSQDEDLEQDKNAVHCDRRRSHAQRRKQADRIWYTRDWRCPKAGLDRKRHTESHDRQADKKKQVPFHNINLDPIQFSHSFP